MKRAAAAAVERRLRGAAGTREELTRVAAGNATSGYVVLSQLAVAHTGQVVTVVVSAL